MSNDFSLLMRLNNMVEFYNVLMDRINFEIRCVAPGIIKSFDATKQTVTVQLVTKEKLVINGILESKKIPELLDVPIYMPRSGDFIITTPITVGDECLCVFSDTCIDAWIVIHFNHIMFIINAFNINAIQTIANQSRGF